MAIRRARDSFLPDFCSREALFFVILIVLLLAIVLVLARGGTLDDMLADFALIALFVTWIALVDVALLCSLRQHAPPLDSGILGGLIFLLLQVITAAFTVAVDYLGDWQLPGWDQNWLATNLPANIGISAIVSIIALRYLFISHRWRAGVRAEARSRFIALQARIRPHFLFNSLNSVAMLTHIDPQAAEDAVLDLAELFRASLREQDAVPLQQDIELGRSYLRIEAQRLGDRLQIVWDLPDPLPSVEVPALTLQPLLENGVYHGIEPLPKGGILKIGGSVNGNMLELEISNPIPEPSAEQRTGNRIALENVRQRLQLASGGRAQLEALRGNGEYRVRLCLPIKKEK
jgi:two-component system sensor histidine kinase AlgZ